MSASDNTTDSLDQFLALCQQRVELELRQLLAVSDRQSGKLQEAMLYASLNGGKRVRPVLVYASALAAGCELQQADKAAAAVELVHCYSLVHDDLPAMDDDDLRRGKPTVHKAFDEATAILVGDALLTLAFQALAESESDAIPAKRCLAMIRALARASGVQGMVAGQALDFAAVGQSLTIEQLATMHALKTGALIGASVELGALCAPDLQDSHLEALRRYAEQIGLAFQIQDDILDVTSDTGTLGKPQGSDQALNKPTYTSILGLEAARSRALALADTAVESLEEFDEQADILRKLALFVVERIH
ncbi:MAG: polyprenyl synthetase family protein [Gammaproteobacteria bacterium]|nr:polyprenyl synthetase family protein [Gammaproteobacteria bacterium]